MKKFKLLASFKPDEYEKAKAEWQKLAKLLVKNSKVGSMSVRLEKEPDGFHIYLYMREN